MGMLTAKRFFSRTSMGLYELEPTIFKCPASFSLGDQEIFVPLFSGATILPYYARILQKLALRKFEGML